MPDKGSSSNFRPETKEEINVATSLNRNTILVEICDRRTQALIDSGAGVSCIQSSMLQKFKQNFQLNPSKISRIIGVGGERHQVSGQVELSLKIGSATFSQNFIVLEHLHHPIILGIDFMKTYGANIDFHRKVLTLCDKTVSVSLISDSKFGYARNTKAVEISAHSESVIPVKISGDLYNKTILLEPSQNLKNLNLSGARCLITLNQRKGVMRLVNPTSNSVFLPSNRIIATVNLIESETFQLGNSNDSNVAENVSSAFAAPSKKGNNSKKKTINFNLDNCAINSTEKQILGRFLNKNKDLFATELSEIGKTDKLTHKIETFPGAKPVHMRFYRQDPIKKAEIEKQTNEMLDANLIKRSTSEWNSPVVLVKKKDGSWRFAVDYRKLNQVTIPISHPLPRVEDVFDAIGESKAKIFTTLDLNSAYFQIPLDPSTSHKSAFVTHEGVFEFTRLPFGLRNSPMSFQSLMSLVLRGLNWKFVLCYIDDILIFSSNFQQHLVHLNEVFKRLRDANLTLKPSKCEFCVDNVMFLGHTVTKNGVLVDSAKTDRIKNFPIPKTQKELRGFLGLCNYYRRFVKDFAKIAVPLNALLKREINKSFSSSDWSTDCQNAFETLKTALISPPILRFPDMNKEFKLSTDASGLALGYILGQVDESGREYVVCYGGRALRPEEKNWSVTELECLAVISGVEAFKHYLTHKHFTVVTDHSALQWLMNKQEPTGRLARWSIKLQGYNFTIKHRKGTQHQNADALSRLDYTRLPNKNNPSPELKNESDKPNSSNVNNLNTENSSEIDSFDENQSLYTEVTFEYKNSPSVNSIGCGDLEPNKELYEIQNKCPDFSDIIKYLDKGILPEDKAKANVLSVVSENQYVLLNNVLYHIFSPRIKKADNIIKEENMILQLAVPQCKRKEILTAYHDCKAGGGHFGVKRTFAAIKQKYWWPKMYQDIHDYVSSCDICQRVKVERNRPAVPLSPLPVEDVFARLHVDILCSLPKSKQGFQYVLLVVDSFSKWTEAFPLKTQEAQEIADILYNEIFTRYGAPRTIVSDRGKNFMSKLVNALCELFEVKRHHTSSYHPQTNATVERANSTLIQTLRAYISKNQENWPSFLPSVMMAFRSTPCTETSGFSPFQLMFGREMNLPIDTSLLPKPTLNTNVRQYFENLLEKLKLVKDTAKKNLEEAQVKSKRLHDQKAKAPDFGIGDLVLIKQGKVPMGMSAKLTDKWEGPFRIVEIGPNFTYKIKDLQNNKIKRSLINATRLKLYNKRPVDRDENAQGLLDNNNPFHNHEKSQENQTENNTSTNDSHEDNITGHEYPKDMSNIRIIKANKKGGRQRYRIQWPDGTREWELEANIPKYAIDTYLKHYTKFGMKRKRKCLPKFFCKNE